MSRTRDGDEYTYVKLVADREDSSLRNGKFWPQLINPTPTNKVNVLVSSDDKIQGSKSDFNFFVDLHTESANVRSIQLNRVIVPLAPQINDHNNVMNITLNGLSSSVSLPNAYYTPNSFVNMLQSQLSTVWNTLIPGAQVLVSYNPPERNITITDISPGPGPYTWQFDASSYYSYGRHIAYFPINNLGVTQTSTSLEMIYSRYYTVRSDRICQSQRAPSLLSSYQPSNIVAVVPIASEYDSTQFSPSASFPGTSKTIYVGDMSPVINTTNQNISLRVLDLSITDEYGFNLDTIFTDGTFQYECAFMFSAYVY